MTGTADRQQFFSRLQPGKTWDILVIGGGATGLGIALEAVARGYTTVLLEQADFAKGTSSRSTKLLHGGVRYLAQGNVKLVREASIERGLLYRNAPHLVRNQTFIIPVYNWFDRIKYTIGLKLYDWIAGKLSLGPSQFISRRATLEQLPTIQSKGLVGGIQYHDGQFDDARMAIDLVQTIREHDGLAINYTRIKSLIKENGLVGGAEVMDMETGNIYSVRAKAVVNATGVFVDEILHMDKPDAVPSIRVSQGVHLVLDKKFFPSSHALMIPATSDGRVLFAVPWHNKVVVGTTDTPVENASLEPVALEKEIRFILETASQYFTQQPKRSDVLSVFAGLRPLAAPQGDHQKTKEISRSHKIIVTASHLFTMVGGKWTTFRKMGEDMLDQVEKTKHWPHQISGTASLPIHGFVSNADRTDPLAIYGSDAANIKALMNGDAHQWISASLKIHQAQVIWAVRHEMARTVEDVLSRRTRALLLDARESVRIAGTVAGIMAAELGKDRQWQENQVAAYQQLAGHYILEK